MCLTHKALPCDFHKSRIAAVIVTKIGGNVMTFGDKVKTLRNQKGWTQEELAKMLGLSKRTVIAYEQGENYPRKRTIYHTLAELFGVDVNYLLTENEEFMTQVGEQYGRRGQIQAESILTQTKELFAGGTLSEEDQIAFLTEMQQIFLDSKKRAREKYTPKKYRKTGEGGGPGQQ